MASVNKATLAKEVDGVVEYIYPKTTADMVEYSDTQTVEDKLKSIDEDVVAVNKRVSTLATGISDGSLSTSNDAELIDIRNPNTDVVGTDVTYGSAGDAVRGQIGTLSDEIANTIGDLYKGYYYEEISVSGEVLATSTNEPIAIKITLSDLVADGLEAVTTKLTQRILDSTTGAINLCRDYTNRTIEEYKNSIDQYKEYVDEANKTMSEELHDYVDDTSEEIYKSIDDTTKNALSVSTS
jgi:hypothetical protein